MNAAKFFLAFWAADLRKRTAVFCFSEIVRVLFHRFMFAAAVETQLQ